MPGRNGPQGSLLAGNFNRLADLEKFPRVKAGEDIADDVPCAKTERYSECKGAGGEHDGGHQAQHLGIDFELGNRHHCHDEKEQA